MSDYPLKLTEIANWYRSKQLSLEGSGVSIDEIRERTAYLPATAADFTADKTMGRINGWVTGEFDFEAIRTPGGEDLLSWHVDVLALDELEDTYKKFIQCLLHPEKVGPDK